MIAMYGFYSLKQTGYAILQEMEKVANMGTLYRLGKPFLSSQEQRDLGDLERAFGNVIDPLYTARNAFIEWNAQCDLELSNCKRTEQVRAFEREKKGVQKLLLEKKKPDYSLLAAKMKSAMLALEVVERTAVRKDVNLEEKIPAGAVEVITVEKAQPFTALKRVEGIFQNAKEYVKIMDKWVGERTLDFVWKVPTGIPVMILVSVVEKKSKAGFQSAYKRLLKERAGNIEIRICEPSEFHDRYIITGEELWQSGPSLKDLGVTKWGTVSKIGNATTKAEIERKFDELWKLSKPLTGD